MPERSSKQGPEDLNSFAHRIMSDATAEGPNPGKEAEKNPAAVALGRLGGLKGGKARADKLDPERRSEIARLAAQARWQKVH